MNLCGILCTFSLIVVSLLQEYLFSGVNEGDMADHTPPLESGQLLSPELQILGSPPPPSMVNGEGPQQVHSDPSLCYLTHLLHQYGFAQIAFNVPSNFS